MIIDREGFWSTFEELEPGDVFGDMNLTDVYMKVTVLGVDDEEDARAVDLATGFLFIWGGNNVVRHASARLVVK